MLKAQNLSKDFQQGDTTIHALKDFNFDFPAGISAIMGPSGSGKTTLLNLLAGFDQPSQGEVHLAGKRIDNLSEDERSEVRLHHTGFIFQNWSLLPTLNAIENVAFPMLLAGVSKDERLAKAEKLLEGFGLKHRAMHKASQLSGGEQQRIAIARALILEPQVLFADEPTGNLDSASGEIVLELLKQHTQGERRLVLVTHDAEVAQLSDRILYLRDGKFEKIANLNEQ